ncbi:MAG: arylsulfatase A-like enzyme [Mariniblastus sp.]
MNQLLKNTINPTTIEDVLLVFYESVESLFISNTKLTCLTNLTLLFFLIIGVLWPVSAFAAEDRLPNIVYIMSDELAYYELSHMGNERLHTPNIDHMAREGIRFTQALAAAPVCGPLRCCMMTGKHMGHASMRTNGGGTPIRAEEPTIASMLKQKNYVTGGFGKWGIGGRGSTGVPEKHGFDVFYGYYDQVHAHSFYPPHLIRNSEEVKLAGNIGGRSGETYSHYEIMKEGLQFIRDNQAKPFLCYFPLTPPHGMYDIPADDPAFKLYENDDWMKDPNVPQDAKNYAAMVSMLDNDLKRVLDLLKELSLEENTIVFFTGDNGGQDRFSSKLYPRGFFGPNVNPKTGVEFRGGKSSLFEGGLRIPFIVRWPGRIEAGQVNDLLFSQVDVMPTLAELTGTKTPGDIDGLSILPTLLGEDAAGQKQLQHEFLYWEYQKQTAVRMKQWKAIRTNSNRAWELFDLSTDISEAKNIAADHPEVLAKMKRFAEQSHIPGKPGTFLQMELQRKDVGAKWGAAPRPPAKKRKKLSTKKKPLS